MSKILLGSVGILPIAISLISLATTTSAETSPSMNGTNRSMPNDLMPTVTSASAPDAFTLDSELSGYFTIPDNPDDNNFTGNQFTEAQTTISDNIGSSTMDQRTNNSTSSTSIDMASETLTSNTTLAASPGADEEEKNSLRQEATSLRIAVIVVSIIAGLCIICIIILIVWLVIQKRKQTNVLSESGIEMRRQQRQLQDEKWPEMRRVSSSDDIDSVSQINQGNTAHSRAHTPAVPSEIYLEPDYPTVGDNSFTPPENLQYNGNGTSANNNQHNDYYNQSSQDNEYYNESSQNNDYYNENSQNNEVYNNIEEGLNQANSLPRREVSNTLLPASSEDIGIYSNFKTG